MSDATVWDCVANELLAEQRQVLDHLIALVELQTRLLDIGAEEAPVFALLSHEIEELFDRHLAFVWSHH
jgi:hypothetical protein